MKKYLLFFCVLLSTNRILSQTSQVISPAELQSVIAPSPNAASLGKYGQIPIGHYTGVPNISIPIYEITSGRLKLPISISYHAVGVKVEEIASWVGLGWSLNAGGVVTRQTRGRPDEMTNGFLTRYQDIWRYNAGVMSASEKLGYEDGVMSGDIDTERDMFYYNFPGGAGSMIYDSTGDMITIPASKLNISGDGASQWVIEDIDGTQYTFTKKETSETNSNFSVSANGYYGSSVSSIYLTRIDNIYGDSILFDYEATYYQFTTIGSQTKKVLIQIADFPGLNCPTTPSAIDYTTSTTTIVGQRLVKIRFNNGEVIFNKDSIQRLDQTGDYSLNNIVIRSSDSSFFKKYNFYYSYSGSAPGSGSSPTYDEYYRLVLDSLKTFDKFGKLYEKHSFQYNNTGLPKRTSFDQDHFGYFNNAGNGNKFYPTTKFTNPYGNNTQVVVGASRKTVPGISQAQMLSSITYPTGGTTYFEYENNKLSSLVDYNDEEYRQFQIGTILNQYYYSDTFSLSKQKIIEFFISTSDCNGGAASLDCPVVTLTGPNNIYYPLPTSVAIDLPPGTYTVTVDLSSVSQEIFDAFYLTAQIPITHQVGAYYQMYGGGHRVKTIFDEDGFGNLINKRVFSYLTPDSTRSSGAMLSFPAYESIFWEYNFSIHPDPECGREYFAVSSASNYPMLSTKGSNVGYSFVREYIGNDGEGGLNEYSFTSPETQGDLTNGGFPYPPSGSREYIRGLPLMETIKRKSTNGYFPVSRKENFYTEVGYQSRHGLKIGTTNAWDMSAHRPVYQHSYYMIPTALELLDSQVVKTYDFIDTNRVSMSYTKYGYNENYFPIYVETKNSKGETIITKTKYWPSFGASLSAGTLSTVIEKKLIKKDLSGNYNVFAGQFLKYKNDRVLPDTIYDLKSVIGVSDTSMSYMAGNNLVKSNLYDAQVAFPKYDIANNLIQQNKIGDISRIYLWDYNKTYPIAEVINADSTHVAYTSFESEGSGNWSIPSSARNITDWRTGKKSFNLSAGTISKSGLNSSLSYKITYWIKSGSATVNSSAGTSGASINSWTYYEHLISGATSVSVSGSGTIDELRLFPINAQMTTYTYIPLVGVSSQADANSRITYFEYDDYGRLFTVRDPYYNILKKYCYNYYGQPEDCGNYIWTSQAISGVYFSQNCTNGSSPDSVIVNISQGAYTSNISQQAANNLAQAAAQAQANQNGTCSWGNTAINANYYSQNCGSGYTANAYPVTIAANTYRSTTSQAAANALAQAAAQNAANTNGGCTQNSCTTSNCTGIDKKCINNICVTGTLTVISSYRAKNENNIWMWYCTKAYCFPDNTQSESWEETQTNTCFSNECQ
jgi:hypothetical protein